LTHGDLGSLNYLLSLFLIKNELSELLLHIFCNILTLLNEVDDLAENRVVGDDFTELGEMPREPLLQAHDESVNVLIHGFNEGNGLDDGLVLTVHISGALLTGVLMGKTELGTGHVLIGELLH
jgi:hypothetical protein